MSTTATISGQEFKVTPRTRLEALSTHRAARRITGSALLGAVAVLLGSCYMVATQGSSVPSSPGSPTVGLTGLVLGVLVLTLAGVLHLRVRALQADPEAWTVAPRDCHRTDHAPASWGMVLRVPRKAWIAVAVVAALWLLGALLTTLPVSFAQSFGSIAIFPGTVLLLVVSIAGFWTLLTAFIYMLWSILPMGEPAGTDAS